VTELFSAGLDSRSTACATAGQAIQRNSAAEIKMGIARFLGPGDMNPLSAASAEHLRGSSARLLAELYLTTVYFPFS
jgi:hypothetical protein